MSSTDSRCARIVTQRVPREANRYRWHVLRYVRRCTYPTSLNELGESIGPQVGVKPPVVAETIEKRDLLALADCGAIEYDLDSRLVCLPEDCAFVDCSRRALDAGTISHLKPSRLDWVVDAEPDSQSDGTVP